MSNPNAIPGGDGDSAGPESVTTRSVGPADSVRIVVGDLVGPLCIAGDDGTKLYEMIVEHLRDGRSVTLSFEGVDTVIPAFLNAAIGRLYGEVQDHEIVERVHVTDLRPADGALLGRVVTNAKRYNLAPEQYDRAWQEGLG